MIDILDFKPKVVRSQVPPEFRKYYAPLIPGWRKNLYNMLFDEQGAVTVTPQNNPVAAKLVVNTDVDESSDDDVTGTTGTMYAIDIDNTNNGAISYVKLYDAASPTVGTTAPDWIIAVAASVRRVLVITEGLAFATALSMAGVTAGGTAGTTGPSSALTVRIVTS